MLRSTRVERSVAGLFPVSETFLCAQSGAPADEIPIMSVTSEQSRSFAFSSRTGREAVCCFDDTLVLIFVFIALFACFGMMKRRGFCGTLPDAAEVCEEYSLAPIECGTAEHARLWQRLPLPIRCRLYLRGKRFLDGTCRPLCFPSGSCSEGQLLALDDVRSVNGSLLFSELLCPWLGSRLFL